MSNRKNQLFPAPMANKQLLFLVILSLINASIQDVTDNKVRSQEESPLAGIAKEIMKEQNLENLGGMVSDHQYNTVISSMFFCYLR